MKERYRDGMIDRIYRRWQKKLDREGLGNLKEDELDSLAQQRIRDQVNKYRQRYQDDI